MAGPNHHPSSTVCEPSSSCCGCAPPPNLAPPPAPPGRCNTCHQRAPSPSPSLPSETPPANSDNQPQDREHAIRGFHLGAPSSAPGTPDTAVDGGEAGHPPVPDPTVQQPSQDNDDPVERELNHLFQEGRERKKKRLSLKRCNGTSDPKRVQPEPQGQQHPASSSSSQHRGHTQNR